MTTDIFKHLIRLKDDLGYNKKIHQWIFYAIVCGSSPMSLAVDCDTSDLEKYREINLQTITLFGDPWDNQKPNRILGSVQLHNGGEMAVVRVTTPSGHCQFIPLASEVEYGNPAIQTPLSSR